MSTPKPVKPAAASTSVLDKALAFRGRHGAERPIAPEAGMHCILNTADVAQMLQEAGESDPFLLAAAMLHDLLQFGSVTEPDIASVFGSEVGCIVAEVTDNPRLSRSTRKALRITIAPNMSRRAKLLKLAQLVASVRNLATPTPPSPWDEKQRFDFFDWVEKFSAATGVQNPTLQAIMLAELERARLETTASGR
ncbi:MAG: HD domain-containing protein [Betaproteobacteria bacterium]|nr:HD domain-containing protein [Betaproteobacteria bacterium]